MDNLEDSVSCFKTPGNPVSRHRRRVCLKSRNGCLECKKRKVKCDERRDSCGACVRRGNHCSFEQSASLPIQKPKSSPHLRHTPPHQLEPRGPMHLSNITDLILLHNYSTNTCATMTTDAALLHFYRTDFISEALKCNYLLHCLLGLSAFHLVQQQRELVRGASSRDQPAIHARIEEYLLVASFHQSAGVSSFRQNITHIDEQNCHNQFAAAVLILQTSFTESCNSVCCFAVTAPSPDAHEHSLNVTKWLILLRGVKTLATGYWDWVTTGPMSPMLASRTLRGYDSEIVTVNQEISTYLDGLCASFVELSSPDTSRICIAAIFLLRKSWAGTKSGVDLGVVFFWGALVEDEFIQLLERLKPEALLVLGAYCALLHTVGTQWWIKRWPTSMLQVIEGHVGKEWKSWLEWPASIIAH